MTVTGSREALWARVEEIRKLAFELTPEGQYRLAFLVAENVGYVLEREPDHPECPHADPAGVTLTVEMIAREVRRAMLDNPTDESFNKRAAAREKIADECARTILALIQSKMGKP